MTEEIASDTDGELSSLDIVFLHQYFSTVRTKPLLPEKKLMLAVLEDAVACFQNHVLQRTRRNWALFRETEKWVCDKSSDYLFSFENICTALNLDSGCVREGLLLWKTRTRAQQKVHPTLALATYGAILNNKHGRYRAIKRTQPSYREKRIARPG